MVEKPTPEEVDRVLASLAAEPSPAEQLDALIRHERYVADMADCMRRMRLRDERIHRERRLAEAAAWVVGAVIVVWALWPTLERFYSWVRR